MLKKIAVLGLSLLMLSSCSSYENKNTVEDDGKLKVITTIFPQYDFSREIAGDNINLTMLISPGAESHSYEPSPQDIIAIQNADVFIYVGGDSEQWAERILSSFDTENLTILSLMDITGAVEEEYKEGMQTDHSHELDDDHDDHDHDDYHSDAEYDEHVWTSPLNAIKIVNAISETFIELDPDNSRLYKENTEKYILSLSDLDNSFREITANAERNTLIFADRFPFRYLADAYNLDYYAAFPGCSTETEASAKTVAFLIDKVKEEHIPYIFHIEFSNEKMADTISSSTGAGKLLLHSCHNVSKQDMDNGVTYLSLMTQNAETLKEALY